MHFNITTPKIKKYNILITPKLSQTILPTWLQETINLLSVTIYENCLVYSFIPVELHCIYICAYLLSHSLNVEIYLCCVCQYFIPLYWWMAFHCINISLFVYVPIDEHLDCFHFGAIMDKPAMNIHV